MKPMMLILLLSALSAGCGSNSSSSGSKCAQRYGTYLEHRSVRDGNCGGISDQIYGSSAQPTTVNSPCTGTIGYSPDNCIVTVQEVCPGAGVYSNFSVTTHGVYTWSVSGDSATGVEQQVIQDSQGTNVCEGTYEVTDTRQSTTVTPAEVTATPTPTPTPTPTLTEPIYTGIYAFGPSTLLSDNCGGDCAATLPGSYTYTVTESAGHYSVTVGSATYDATQLVNYVSFTSQFNESPPAGCTSEVSTNINNFFPSGTTATGTFENDISANCTSGIETCVCKYSFTGTFEAQ